MKFRSLDVEKIAGTAERLENRVRERFPTRGINSLAHELVQITDNVKDVAEFLRRPLIWYRVAAIVFIVLMFSLIAFAFHRLDPETNEIGMVEFLTGFESVINDIVFVGIAIFFLITFEKRIKRGKALATLHELRSMAHIIDMHQLTKDPDRTVEGYESTESSPKGDLSAYELKRYFDYCREMLSITSKLAAILIQDFDDPVTLAAVNEVETLTNGLSRKVWQKISVTDRIMESEEKCRSLKNTVRETNESVATQTESEG